ncbi:MAG: tetratricopeptide repeat protein [Myxococcaceae bacterium]|nr:tetratricopeptide repeat protein [Myxococcaceae bacterium]MBH2005829.1 tetratricopeptide repeat protein [Myxococcaceae bacterium]
MKILWLLLFLACSPKPEPKPSYAMAEQLFEQQKFIEASKILSFLLDDQPTLPGARNLLARCFFFLGNPNRSFEELEFVLQSSEPLSEASLDALFLMGAISLESASLRSSNDIKGEQAWKLYLKVSPHTDLKAKVQSGLAEIQMLKNPKKATDLARSYIQNSNPSKALLIFARLLSKHPHYVPAWHYQGMAYVMNQDPQNAIRSWKQVLQRDPAYARRFKLHERMRIAENL